MLTDKKDLRGGLSLWSDQAGGAVRARTKLQSERCDVAVVGAGVSGALIALTLARAGCDVVVLDRRRPGEGSTAASTAMIQFELDTPLRELADKIGGRRAARAYRRSLRAVDDLRSFAQAENIRCDWRDRDALYLAGDELGFRALREEAKARRRAGLPSEFVESGDVQLKYGIERTGAILSQGAAELNPAKLCAGALNAARRRGCRIYAEQEVVGVKRSSKGVQLTTAADGEVLCSKAIFATGYETADGLPKSSFEITSSWAIATKPIDPKNLWPSRCLIWEASDPYLYLRTTADHRVVAGGLDSKLNNARRRDDAIPSKARQLLVDLNKLLPGRDFELEYAWGGAFAESPTGLPIFTQIDDFPGCMAVLGCGGNGITFSMIAAQIVEGWVTARPDVDATLFDG
jgi:glycine/D-amino acid oxidase-like deaminating enzyme